MLFILLSSCWNCSVDTKIWSKVIKPMAIPRHYENIVVFPLIAAFNKWINYLLPRVHVKVSLKNRSKGKVAYRQIHRHSGPELRSSSKFIKNILSDPRQFQSKCIQSNFHSNVGLPCPKPSHEAIIRISSHSSINSIIVSRNIRSMRVQTSHYILNHLDTIRWRTWSFNWCGNSFIHMFKQLANFSFILLHK